MVKLIPQLPVVMELGYTNPDNPKPKIPPFMYIIRVNLVNFFSIV
jgi:hypothetical protein